MSKRRKRRTPRALHKLIVILIAIVIVILVGYFFILKPAKQKIASVVAEKLIESQIPDGFDADAEDFFNSMSEEDQKTIEDMISKHISAGTISDISSYVANGDTAALKEYAKNSLTEEELEELKNIYEKYQDEIMDYIQ